ncbi:hypothetical protein [Flagellimonas myxillae]|uniref:hypothetical protein n=1 Tax=Flagellimonas myxillae TaxID=2942214 RepID=UPI00201F18DD|nr:hypothetical protein [Muricauda myxillae]MCL6267101.1 hypothetical protein [Muricauda myxillae]
MKTNTKLAVPLKKNVWSKLAGLILPILIIGCTGQAPLSLETESFKLGLDGQGKVVELVDQIKSNNYSFSGEGDRPILSIQVNGALVQPATCNYDPERKTLTLTYPENDIVAKVTTQFKTGYLTFELTSVTHEDKIELVQWGPFETTIKETIGETVGVVRNSDFAIGIQALNIRTLGGVPENTDDSTPSYDIFGTTSLVDVSDSLNILYRGHTAQPKDYGSSLQAYTRNRTKDRVVATMNHEKYIAPAYKDEGIIGSKIALFGCLPEDVLNTIEAIELEEGLPHPMLDGVWGKRAPKASSSYLIQDFTAETVDQAIALTKKAGLKYLYHPGPFENWGHFDLKKDAFPENWDSMKACVLKAEKEGIAMGVHTLSNFITTNDPYVSPIPDDRLAKVGISSLSQSIDQDAKDIEIDDPTYFNQMKNNNLHAAVIGKEIIRYESVSEQAPWKLLNCERGAFGTSKLAHEKGAGIAKLADHGYKTFLTNTALSIEMASTIADLFNQTGLKQISFDGLEGNNSTGMGAYGKQLFVNEWYSKLNPDIKNNYIMDASNTEHYFWHMFTRMNWGEPWYAGFRESQTAYRLLNQDYFRRNYIPGMLGWFSMHENTSLEDIEWMLARSAGFDAGYALVTSAELISKNGFGDQILEKIKQWEKARMSKVFSKDQKKRMEDIGNEFTLESSSEDSWDLIPYEVYRFEHKFKVRQPGEPIWSSFDLNNTNTKQPLQFILSAKGNTVNHITVEINGFKKNSLEVTLQPGQYLKYNGGKEAVLYSKTWNRIRSIPMDAGQWTINKGDNTLQVDCQFHGTEEASLKLELKTAGHPEEVAAKQS